MSDKKTPSVADVESALRLVRDPELGLDIVSLGLIYDISVQPNRVEIVMTLTTPGCPLVPFFRQDIEQKVKQATGVTTVEITLSFDPPWSPDKMTTEAKQQLTLIRG